MGMAGLGSIHYQITYESNYKRLRVSILECKELKNMDTFGKSDPFVQVLFVPGKHVEMETKVIRNDLNPVFDNEDFMSEVSLDASRKLTVVFRVFDWDHLSKNDEIGEAQVPLWKLNLSQITDEWKFLHTFTGIKDKPILKVGLPAQTSFTDC